MVCRDSFRSIPTAVICKPRDSGRGTIRKPSGGEGEQSSPEDGGTLVAVSEDGTNWKTVVASESLGSVSALRQGGFLANGQMDPGDALKSYMFTSGDGQSAGNAGTHLKKLADSGYLTVTKAFVDNRPQTMYSTTEEGRNALSAYRRTMSAFLDSLKV